MKYPAVLGPLLLLTVSNSAQALEVLGGVGVLYEYSDNVAQAPVGEQDEETVVPRIDLTLVEEAGRLRGSATAFVERVDYRNNLIQDETRYNLAGVWGADLIKNRVLWVIEEAASRRLLDVRDADISTNRQDQNQLLTGPDINFSAGLRDRLLLSMRYGNSWYGDAVGFDNERYIGRVEVQHQLSPVSSAALSYEKGRTHFLDEGVDDYDRDEVLFSLRRQLSRSSISLGLGYNRVLPEAGGQYDGVLGAGGWRYQWRDNTYTEIKADWRLTDSGQQAIENALGGGVDVDLLVSNDVYQLKTYGLLSGWSGRSWSADVYMRAEQQDYQTQPLDQRLAATEVSLRRTINQATVLSAVFDAARRKFDTGDRTDDEFTVDTQVSHVFSSLFFGALGGSYTKSDSSVPGANFRETIVYVEFGLRGSLLARERGRELRNSGARVN